MYSTENTPIGVLDELLGEAPAPVQDSLLQKIRGVGRGIFEKYGSATKPVRGAPVWDGDPKSSDVPLNAPASLCRRAGRLAMPTIIRLAVPVLLGGATRLWQRRSRGGRTKSFSARLSNSAATRPTPKKSSSKSP